MLFFSFCSFWFFSFVAFDYQKLGNEVNLKDFRNEKLCLFCEEYAEMALDYLADNKTQTEIIEVLHISCYQFGALKKEVHLSLFFYQSVATKSFLGFEFSCW